MTCQTTSLVQCDKCQKQYVGQTTQNTPHPDEPPHPTYKKENLSNTWWHFNKEHSIHDVRVIPLQQIDGKLLLEEAKRKLQYLKTLWTKRLAIMQPLGMNFVLKDTQQRTH